MASSTDSASPHPRLPSQQFAFFDNIPQLTKGIAALISFVFLVVSFSPRAFSVLALIPANTFIDHFYLWNVFTGGLVELSLLSLLLDLLFIVVMGKFVEPIWGSKEFLRFVGITNTLTGVGVVLFALLWTVVARSTAILHISFLGFVGVIAAFSVAVRQLVPDHEISLFVVFAFRAKHLPSFFLALCFFFGLLTGVWIDMLLAVVGFVCGWTYLRFFQPRGNGLIGDLSSQFAFAELFPHFMRHPVAIFSSAVYSGFVRMGLFVRSFPPTSTDGISSPLLPSSYGGGRVGGSELSADGAPSSPSDQDVERRRQLALKALDERMALLQQQEKDMTPSSAAGNV